MTTIKDVECSLRVLIDNGKYSDKSNVLAMLIAGYLIERDKPEEEELKPCPLCGTQVRIYEEQLTGEDMMYGVTCAVCIACTSTLFDRDRVIKAWNKRAE